MSAGYIYVLVNSSMPGLVKVGKTKRDPSDRVAELSGATGVATPFVMAFKQFFADCDLAEIQIHHALEIRGHRVSAGREFFRAEPDEIIHLLIDTAKLSVVSSAAASNDDDADILNVVLDDEFCLPDRQPEPPWTAILQQADDLYYGTEDEVEDPARAIPLYKDAIRLGCLIAYERLGLIYHDGEAVRQDDRKALDYFRTGAEKGNYYCWAEMAHLFHRNESDQNATKCWKRFFESRQMRPDAFLEEFPTKFMMVVCHCCIYCMCRNEHQVLLDYLRKLSQQIEAYCDQEIAVRAARGEGDLWNLGIKRWVSQL